MSNKQSTSVDRPKLPKPRFPFNEPDSDIVIRSCDGAEFKTHKFYLSKAAVVFRDTFTLPDSGDRGGLQTVDLAENSATVDLLLSWCDPRALSGLGNPSLDTIFTALTAAEKYQMTHVSLLPLQQHALTSTSPLRVYAIACHSLRFDRIIAAGIAKAAALKLLEEKAPFHLQGWKASDVQSLPGAYLHALYEFHLKCGEAASKLVADPAWCTSYSKISYVSTDGKSFVKRFAWLPADRTVPHTWSGINFSLPEWWMEYMDILGKKLIDTPRCNLLVDSMDQIIKLRKGEKIIPDQLFSQRLTEFLLALRSEADKEIAKVSLNLWK